MASLLSQQSSRSNLLSYSVRQLSNIQLNFSIRELLGLFSIHVVRDGRCCGAGVVWRGRREWLAGWRFYSNCRGGLQTRRHPLAVYRESRAGSHSRFDSHFLLRLACPYALSRDSVSGNRQARQRGGFDTRTSHSLSLCHQVVAAQGRSRLVLPLSNFVFYSAPGCGPHCQSVVSGDTNSLSALRTLNRGCV